MGFLNHAWLGFVSPCIPKRCHLLCSLRALPVTLQAVWNDKSMQKTHVCQVEYVVAGHVGPAIMMVIIPTAGQPLYNLSSTGL